ncbi:MAG: hypothetical protein MI922_26395 [Bacteroidales bacterium]|nr:hypothetical protein [Bacteroidales bacterium]
MKLYTTIFSTLIILCSSTFVIAQDEERGSLKNEIMLTPQYGFINGLRVDYERNFKKNALLIAPRIHINTNGENFFSYNDYEEMIGLGLNLGYKVNFIPESHIMVPYMMFGAYYTWYHLTLEGDSWVPYYYDNIQAQTLVNTEKTIQIHKVGPDVLVGFQFIPIPQFVMDVSAGIGMRYSITASENKELVDNQFNSSILDPGFTGILPVINFKIGYRF